MKLDKAIEILSQDLTYTYPAHFNDLQDAVKLGSEALKRIQKSRLIGYHPQQALLPGEPEE